MDIQKLQEMFSAIRADLKVFSAECKAYGALIALYRVGDEVKLKTNNRRYQVISVEVNHTSFHWSSDLEVTVSYRLRLLSGSRMIASGYYFERELEPATPKKKSGG